MCSNRVEISRQYKFGIQYIPKIPDDSDQCEYNSYMNPIKLKIYKLGSTFKT